MAQLVNAPTKYSTFEWHKSNNKNYSSAETERASAERLQSESKRLTDETDEITRFTQEDVNKKLAQRLRELNFWKDEVQSQLQAVDREIDTLLKYKGNLENSLESIEHPQSVTTSCLTYRQGREGIDLVQDDVENNLLKEVEVIEGVRSVLVRTLEQTVEQIRRLRSAKYFLQKDVADKNAAISIDNSCHNLNNKDTDINLYEGVTQDLVNAVMPADWSNYSDSNIKKAECEKQASVTLRSVISGVVEQTRNDLLTQCRNVDLALKKRVEECTNAKERLTGHLEKVDKEIENMEGNISQLKAAIDEKLAPLKVAHTRLAQRSQRPNIELTRDPAQYQLVNEVKLIEASISALESQLEASEASLKGLIRNQIDLKEDIRVKTKSLHIDKVLCQDLRATIDYSHY